MNYGTYMQINARKISENAARIVKLCADNGIEVLGVTKGFAALPQIVSAMIDGGVKKLADSRLQNIYDLRQKGFTQNITLLRIPSLSNVENVVKLADCSVNSEYATIEGLSGAAIKNGLVHDILLMIDVGDLREGILPSDVHRMAERVTTLKGVRIAGLGTNMGCYGGILPTGNNLNLLIDISKEIERAFHLSLEFISGGGTSSLKLVHEGLMPKGINQLRIGEAMLLGTDTTRNDAISWLHQDAFLLKVEVIEVKFKPSVPIGITGFDAFGNQPDFEDRGMRKRAIISIGRQDVNIDGLIPADSGMSVLGASSDHMIVDVTDAAEPVKVGSQIIFRLNYQGMLFLSNSRYVKKVYVK